MYVSLQQLTRHPQHLQQHLWRLGAAYPVLIVDHEKRHPGDAELLGLPHRRRDPRGRAVAAEHVANHLLVQPMILGNPRKHLDTADVLSLFEIAVEKSFTIASRRGSGASSTSR